MKNFSVTLTNQLINKIIKSHDGGIVGNLLENNIKDDLEELKGQNKQLGNLIADIDCSEHTINFLDNFFCDIKAAEKNEDCSVFARNVLDQ